MWNAWGEVEKNKAKRLVEARFVKNLRIPAKIFGLDSRGNSELSKVRTLHNGSSDYRVMGRILQP